MSACLTEDCRGAILTPQEMNDLTESWKPYRSLGRQFPVIKLHKLMKITGVYYMWSLAESEVA